MRGLARIGWCAVAVAAVSLCEAEALAVPPADGQFTYHFERTVGRGGGEYVGYHDTLSSDGSYVMLGVQGDVARFRAVYDWRYSNTEGKVESGHEDREVQFRVSDRRYVGPRTDLDEWDTKNATQLAVWFWIPPGVQPGQTVQILDLVYTVVRRDAVVELGDRDVQAIEVVHQGRNSRNDDYGELGYDFTDRYFFDPATGMIISEDYDEHDVGVLKGLSASFHLEETLEVRSTSYPLDVVWLPRIIGWLKTGGCVLAPFLGLFFFVRWNRNRPRTYRVDGIGQPVKVRFLGPKDPPLPPPRSGMTQHFGTHLPDLVRKAHLAGDKVAVATDQAGDLLGVGIINGEAKIGTILSPNTEITEHLRKHLRVLDFFSESRHAVPDKVKREFTAAGVSLPTEHAYNVYETYQVLAVAPPPAPAYDTSVVSMLTPADLEEIEKISRTVYKVPSAKWLRAQLDGGDFGFVARVDGKIVGFALASLQGNEGRVHTNTLLPEHRGKGIGKELMRARLRTLSDLGAERVITEIADWNLPSLEVARSFGFAPIGTMVVETARVQRIERAIVRR